MAANDLRHSFLSRAESCTVDPPLSLHLHFLLSFQVDQLHGLLADLGFSTQKDSSRVYRSSTPCKMPVLRLIRQRLPEEWPGFNLGQFGHAIGRGSLFLLANILVNLVCNRASNEEAKSTSVLTVFVQYIPVSFFHYFPLTIVTVIAWFVGHQFFIRRPRVLPVVAEPAHPQAIGHPHHQGTGIPGGTRPVTPQGTGPPHPQGAAPLDPQVIGPLEARDAGPLDPQRTRPAHAQGTRILDPQDTGCDWTHSQGPGTSNTKGGGDGPRNQGSRPPHPQGTGTLHPQLTEASHLHAIGHPEEQPPLQDTQPPHENGTVPTDLGVVDDHFQLLIYNLKRHIATESMSWGEGNSGNAALTIHLKGVNVREVERVFQSKLTLSGSKILHKRLGLGPQTGILELEEFRTEIIESMRRARILDPECTLQLGSFAVVKYTDSGHLKWWRLQRHWTPTISNIRRSPRSLLDLLRNSNKKWTVRGFNLQTATLKASTADESEKFRVLSYHKMESGEDLVLCEETHLVQNSAPLFNIAVYICAANFVEVEPGLTINLESEPKNIQRAYWMSVMESFIPNPWTMIITLSLALLGGLSSGADETPKSLFPTLALRHLAVQHGGDVIGVNLEEDSFLSNIVGEIYKSFLVYIFFIVILDLVVSLLRELSPVPVPSLGDEIPVPLRTVASEDFTETSSPASSLSNEDESMKTDVTIEEEGSPAEDSSNSLNPISLLPHDNKCKRIGVSIREEGNGYAPDGQDLSTRHAPDGPPTVPEGDTNVAVPSVIAHLDTKPGTLDSSSATEEEIVQENEGGVDETNSDILKQSSVWELGSEDGALHDPSDDRYIGKALPSSRLPPSWVQWKDLDTGKLYYVNHSTAESQCALPSVTDVVPPLPPPQALPPLPSNWKEATDIATGHKYYYNTETHLSTWERPKPGNVTADPDRTKPESSSTGTFKATSHDTSNSTAFSSISDSAKIPQDNDDHPRKIVWWRRFREKHDDPGKSKIGWQLFKRGGDRSGKQTGGWLSVEKKDLAVIPQRFTYRQLRAATENFRSVIGEGGFGSVYLGVLPSSKIPVAVKRLKSLETSDEPFMNEVFIMGQLRHRNLVQLLGWCAEPAKKQFLIVCELMPNGNLADELFGPDPKMVLSWPQRFTILTGTAAGVDYLHNGWNQRVIHRDIKCNNIFLDDEWNAKLGDFGIARLLSHQDEAVTTLVAGTLGYLAPEVVTEGRVTDKADVYAFGAVALEVACGRRIHSFTSDPEGRIHLVDWVWHRLSEGNLLSAVDKGLALEDCDTESMELVLRVGLLCSHPDPQVRPSMRKVVQILNGDLPVPSVPASKPTPVYLD